MDRSQENTTNLQNQSEFWNVAEDLIQPPEHAFTNISLGLGTCTTIINVTMMCLLLRHKQSFNVTGFWLQLVFLCCTDILSGIAVAFPPFGFLFFDIHADVYYTFCITGIFLFPLSITLSAGNCFIISIQRFVILRYIDEPNTIWYKRATPIMAFGNVLLSIVTFMTSVLVITIIFDFQYEEFCDKVNMTGQNEYKSKYIIGTTIMLAVFLIGTNTFTVLSIVKVFCVKSVQLNSPSASTNSLNIMNRNRYVTTTFILIVFALNITTVPSLLFLFASMINNVKVSAKTTEVISRLVFMNSLLNPFIYCLRTTEFRSAVWRDMKAILSRIKCCHDAP